MYQKNNIYVEMLEENRKYMICKKKVCKTLKLVPEEPEFFQILKFVVVKTTDLQSLIFMVSYSTRNMRTIRLGLSVSFYLEPIPELFLFKH